MLDGGFNLKKCIAALCLQVRIVLLSGIHINEAIHAASSVPRGTHNAGSAENSHEAGTKMPRQAGSLLGLRHCRGALG